MRLWPKKKPDPELTDESFTRWLRAGRPPFTWFLGQSEDNQERMAAMGDAYVQDVCVGIGWAVRDPAAAEAAVGAAGGDKDAEVSLVQQLASQVLARMTGSQGHAGTPDVPPRDSKSPGAPYAPPRMRPTGRVPT